MADDRLLSPADLAAREGVPLQTVYDWNMKGTGPRYFRAGKYVRYRLDSVLAWERQRERAQEAAGRARGA